MKDNLVFGELGDDPSLPNVILKIGGKDRHLCFDFNAIVKAEQVTGINLLKAAVSAQSAETVRGLLWAALLRDEPELTIEEVGKWIRPNAISVINEAVLTAWFGSVTEDEGKEAVGEANDA